ncbi:MAG: hypothetical protein ABIK28_03140, partial [Planctomycetota bacterium]
MKTNTPGNHVVHGSRIAFIVAVFSLFFSLPEVMHGIFAQEGQTRTEAEEPRLYEDLLRRV